MDLPPNSIGFRDNRDAFGSKVCFESVTAGLVLDIVLFNRLIEFDSRVSIFLDRIDILKYNLSDYKRKNSQKFLDRH